MLRMGYSHYLWGLMGLAALLATPAQAAVTEKDVLVIGRVIALLDHAPKGNVTMAVAQGNAATYADVASLTTMLGEGKTIGDITLTTATVRYDQLDHSSAKIIFIPEGLSDAEMQSIFATAQAHKLVTISTSDACLKIQKCAISITSEPAVDIRLSLAAAAATNVSFGATFQMMIKEVQ